MRKIIIGRRYEVSEDVNEKKNHNRFIIKT